MGREGTTVEREKVTVIPYGNLAQKITFANRPGMRLAKNWRSEAKRASESQLLVASVRAMDEKFRESFRERSSGKTRILVINDAFGTDTLLSRLLNLNIRSPERFYVAEPKKQKEDDLVAMVESLLARMSAAVAAQESDSRILDARIEDGVLRVISPSFKRLEVPISSIPRLNEVGEEQTRKFEIDVDGSYLYWPDLDIHLGWEQFNQVVDPEATQKAQRKSREFNIRYGAAIKRIREAAGLSLRSIAGLSAKQLRRIESGQCRSTSNALQKLARAHHLETNEYMQRVAEAMR
jgi:hypothetical protein